MGSNDILPAHVPSHVKPICNALLQFGGGLWTVCYALYVRESFKSKSYGMPLFALAQNFAWELVYAVYVAESPLEKSVFTLWLLFDFGMIYGVVKFGKYEWRQSPWIAKNVGAILIVMIAVATLGQWTFAKWWIDNEIGKKEGKPYRGVIGPDTNELGFWTAAVAQLYLSAASLCQLLVRQHSGGVNWSIWACRMFGSISGLYLNYAWAWFHWPDAHGYFVSPFALFLWVGGFVSDLAYAFVLWRVQQTEIVLTDGRKTSRNDDKVTSDKQS